MSWDISDIKNWGPDKHERGAVIPVAGNAVAYVTGGWRTNRPVRDDETCTQCLFCYFYCPDSSVIVKGQEVVDFDLDHCKGCAQCATECPVDAITMHPESEFRRKP